MSNHLMGPGEIRERIYQITSDPSLPQPYDEFRMGKVWRIEDIEAWLRDHSSNRDG